MVTLKTEAEIEVMAEGGRRLAEILVRLVHETKEGVSLVFLDGLAKRLMEEAGGRPAFLDYKPYGATRAFPASICASLNDVVVHGIPTRYTLKTGDTLKIDLGLIYKNFYTDTATTVTIGPGTPMVQKLIAATKKALELGIAETHPDKTLGDIGYIIHRTVAGAGFKIVKGLTGHGIGHELHEDPSVFNEGKRGKGLQIKPGMVLAIEVMSAVSSEKIVQRNDDSYATADGSIAAHFEHTVAITKEGPRILTMV